MPSKLMIVVAALAALLLATCGQSGTSSQTITLQQIQDDIKATCNYVPTINSIAEVAATITSTIDPATGAAAAVLVATGNSIVTAICRSVMAQQAKMGAKKGEPTVAQTLDVEVNGVTVHGTLTPKETKT